MHSTSAGSCSARSCRGALRANPNWCTSTCAMLHVSPRRAADANARRAWHGLVAGSGACAAAQCVAALLALDNEHAAALTTALAHEPGRGALRAHAHAHARGARAVHFDERAMTTTTTTTTTATPAITPATAPAVRSHASLARRRQQQQRDAQRRKQLRRRKLLQQRDAHAAARASATRTRQQAKKRKAAPTTAPARPVRPRRDAEARPLPGAARSGVVEEAAPAAASTTTTTTAGAQPRARRARAAALDAAARIVTHAYRE